MLNQQMSIIERPLRWLLPPEALRTDHQGPSGQKFLRHTLGGSHPTTMRRLRLCSQIAEMTQPPDKEAARGRKHMLGSAGFLMHACLCAKSLQLCLTVCNPMDWSSPGSSVHGILQVRILEWVAMPSSRGSSRPRDQTHVSYVSCFGRLVLYH